MIVFFTIRDRRGLLYCFFGGVSLAKSFHKFLKNQVSHQKLHKIWFWSTLLKFAESGKLENAETISLSSTRELIESRLPIKVSWN